MKYHNHLLLKKYVIWKLTTLELVTIYDFLFYLNSSRSEFHYVGRTEITPFSVNFGKASFAFFLVINKKLEWGSISNKLLLVGFSFSFNVSVNAVCFSSIPSFVNIYGFLMDKTFLWMVSQFHKKEPMANPHLKKIVFYSII